MTKDDVIDWILSIQTPQTFTDELRGQIADMVDEITHV